MVEEVAEPAAAEDTSIERLLLNIDTSSRTEVSLVRGTIAELFKAASEEEGRDVRAEIKRLLVVAFKRRNHKKSQADGEGAGEKAIFQQILLAVIELGQFNDLVEAVLALVPSYGCWKDLAAVAEQLTIRAGEGTTVMHPIAEAICQLFAEQMLQDDSTPEGVPANACKYCPHDGRHRRDNKRKREEVKEEVKESSNDRHALRAANEVLGERIGQIVCPSAAPRYRHAALRKLRARLNQRLAQAGHAVEPLVCRRALASIDFAKACKGALLKYKKAIKKDAAAADKWAKAMATNSKAIPDMDSLLAAADAFLSEEVQGEGVQGEGEGELRMFALQMKKAVSTIGASQRALLKKAKDMLVAAGRTSSEAQQVLEALPRCVVVVDTANVDMRRARLALVLGAVLLVLAQGEDRVIIDGQLVELSAERWDEAVPAAPAAMDGALRRLEASLTLALAEGTADVLLLCQRFAAYEEDSDAVLALLTRLQAPAGTPSGVLRSLRVHRVRHSITSGGGGGEEVAYVPRGRDTPLDPVLASADLLLLVDFTGSMGSYMSAVKAELLALVQELATSTRLKHISVGFVGYRDFGDTGRVVTVPFKPHAELEQLLDTIRSEEPDGGNDAPEDMLSGLVAAAALRWTGDVRVMVIITDADAHGTGPKHGDNYPDGRCPDQRAAGYPSLAQAMGSLAEGLRVDTFFCKLNNGNEPTQRALKAVYDERCGGQGFGTIAMQQQGVENFRASVLAAVSTAVLGTLAAKDVSGLQTADGTSVSSLLGSLLASTRESLAGLGLSLEDKKDAETDMQRLERELLLEELQPVRAALGMPWPAHLQTLSAKAAQALHRAGLTVEALLANGYPAPIIEMYTAYLQKTLAQI